PEESPAAHPRTPRSREARNVSCGERVECTRPGNFWAILLRNDAMKLKPLVLFVSDGPPPGPFPQYRALTAKNADEAVRMLRTERPTAIVGAAVAELVGIYV